MTVTSASEQDTRVVYDLVGTLLEACSCGVLCPCWIGEDPDEGACFGVVAYHFSAGTITGIDVGGHTLVQVLRIPGNVLAGGYTAVTYVDDQASDEQAQAILDAYEGRLGGPLADLAGLVGDVLAVVRAPITHELTGGQGVIRVGETVFAEMEPYRSPDGETITTLRDSLFSTVPGSPAYVSKAHRHVVNLPQYGMVWSFEGRNAIQSDYRITHRTGE